MRIRMLYQFVLDVFVKRCVCLDVFVETRDKLQRYWFGHLPLLYDSSGRLESSAGRWSATAKVPAIAQVFMLKPPSRTMLGMPFVYKGTGICWTRAGGQGPWTSPKESSTRSETENLSSIRLCNSML